MALGAKKFLTLFVGLMVMIALIGACSNEPTLTDADVNATVNAAVSGTTVAQADLSTMVAQTVAAMQPPAETVIEDEANVGAVITDTEVPAPATWTAVPGVIFDTPEPDETAPAPPTSTPLPTAVASETPFIPTNTPAPTETAVPPTNVPEQPVAPPPTAAPTANPNPVFGGELLPNHSFEDGWYNMNGVPELQLPSGFGFEWDEGRTGYGDQPWDQWFRPETRVLPYFQIPESERALFIRDGEYTIKIFKGNGPISFRLYADVALQPGTYLFRVRAFPDLVAGYENGSKVWAPDPTSGEIRFIGPGGGTDWIMPAFGQWNVLEYSFTIDEPQTVRVGIAIRARYGLSNNGFFFDDWDLQQSQ